MTAREIDAAVAEKVMGWTRVADCGYALIGHHPDGGHAVPHYSTDIAAAWEVVERLNHLNPTIHYEDTCCQWSCELNTGLSGRRFEAYSDESAAHAICLAALKAVGATVET